MKSMANLFKLLSVEPRLKIIVKLAQAERLCVGALAKDLGITQGAVSQHLRLLKDGGLVSDARCGYHIHYSLNREALGNVLPTINSLCAPKRNPEKCHKKKCLKTLECKKNGRE